MIPLELRYIKLYFNMYKMWQVEVKVIDVDPRLTYLEHSWSWAYKNNTITFQPCDVVIPDYNRFKPDNKYTIELGIHKLNILNFDTEEQADMFIKECKLFIDHYNENVLKISPFHIEIQDQFTILN